MHSTCSLRPKNNGGPLDNQFWHTCINVWPQQSFQSLVFLLRQLNIDQWNSLPFCLPSLIVQWLDRIFHYKPLSQSCTAVEKSRKFWQATGLSKLGRQNEKLLHSSQCSGLTLEDFVAASRLYTKFDCAVACPSFSLLATVHDCKTVLHVLLYCTKLWNWLNFFNSFKKNQH